MTTHDYIGGTRVSRYGMAVLVSMLALGARLGLAPVLGGSSVFLQDYPAVMFSAWYGGRGPGLLATLLCGLGTMWSSLPPVGSVAVAHFGDRIAVALFAVVGVVISVLNEKLHQARWRVQVDSEMLRRQAAASRHTEARKAAMLDTAFDALVGMDASGRVVEWNLAAARLFGYSREEAVGQDLAELIIPPALRDCHRAGLVRHLASGASTILGKQVEVRARRADASEFSVEVAVTRVDDNGSPLFEGCIRDITERRDAEVALRESQALFRQFMEHSPALAFVRDSSGRIVYVNAAYERFFGMPLQSLKGRALQEVVPEATARRLQTLYNRVLTEQISLEVQETIPDPAGQPHDCIFYLFPIEDSTGQILVGGKVLDVSEQRALESRLRQGQKMEAVGQLAGGIAHDFNNILAVINGYSELLLGQPGQDPSTRAQLSEIRKAGDRAAALTRQLLAFSRKQVVAPELLDFNDIIRNLNNMVRRLIGEDVELVTALTPEPALVRADPGQMEQVLLNLLLNARDAMPRGGQVTVETRNVELDAESVQHRGSMAAGTYVLLAVSDTGHGMTRAVQERIFEPFFTTKEPGKGTGLGLATVFGIAQQSGGHVSVYSEPNIGTTFQVYLPRAIGAGHPSAQPEADKKALSGTETILLAEDDAQVRTMVRTVLRESGFTVLVAQSAEEALELCAAHPDRIDLLLTDVVMPGMSGRDLAERIQHQRPKTRVLFMSGYTDDAVVRHGILSAQTDFIQKPFSPVALVRKLRVTLDNLGS